VCHLDKPFAQMKRGGCRVARVGDTHTSETVRAQTELKCARSKVTIEIAVESIQVAP
jgi:hypothetical protein